MYMAVVQVRPMRMTVLGGGVIMRMRVAQAGGYTRVDMSMVRVVVPVRVLVGHGVMGVFVDVALPHQKDDAGDEQRDCEGVHDGQ